MKCQIFRHKLIIYKLQTQNNFKTKVCTRFPIQNQIISNSQSELTLERVKIKHMLRTIAVPKNLPFHIQWPHCI